jgi:hypothetical protein
MAREPSIQYAEPVAFAMKSGIAQFDAYGRRFSLTLIDNERVLSKLPVERRQQLSAYRMLRGSLNGAPGSWVRLTEFNGGVEGAIWDGQDLYTVTTYERIAPYLTSPINAAPGQTVVYRLSDSRDVLPRDFCELGDVAVMAKASNGLEQYEAVVQGIEGSVITPQLSHQIEISLIADSDFQAAEPGDPTGHARAPQHRRRHLQRTGGPAGARHRRAPDTRGQRPVQSHQGPDAARAVGRVSQPTPRRARAASRTL